MILTKSSASICSSSACHARVFSSHGGFKKPRFCCLRFHAPLACSWSPLCQRSAVSTKTNLLPNLPIHWETSFCPHCKLRHDSFAKSVKVCDEVGGEVGRAKQCPGEGACERIDAISRCQRGLTPSPERGLEGPFDLSPRKPGGEVTGQENRENETRCQPRIFNWLVPGYQMTSLRDYENVGNDKD